MVLYTKVSLLMEPTAFISLVYVPKMQAEGSSKTLVQIKQLTQLHITNESNLSRHHSQNYKSQVHCPE
jgi:hypothetical protein